LLRSRQFGGQNNLGPLEKPLEIADYVFFPHKKITFRMIRNSAALIVKMGATEKFSWDLINKVFLSAIPWSNSPYPKSSAIS